MPNETTRHVFVLFQIVFMTIAMFMVLMPTHWKHKPENITPLHYEFSQHDDCGSYKIWTMLTTKRGWTVFVCSKEELQHGQ